MRVDDGGPAPFFGGGSRVQQRDLGVCRQGRHDVVPRTGGDGSRGEQSPVSGTAVGFGEVVKARKDILPGNLTHIPQQSRILSALSVELGHLLELVEYGNSVLESHQGEGGLARGTLAQKEGLRRRVGARGN